MLLGMIQCKTRKHDFFVTSQHSVKMQSFRNCVSSTFWKQPLSLGKSVKGNPANVCKIPYLPLHLTKPSTWKPCSESKRGVAVHRREVQIFHLLKKVSDKGCWKRNLPLEGDKYWLVIRNSWTGPIAGDKPSEGLAIRGDCCYCVGCFGMEIDHLMWVTLHFPLLRLSRKM